MNRLTGNQQVRKTEGTEKSGRVEKIDKTPDLRTRSVQPSLQPIQESPPEEDVGEGEGEEDVEGLDGLEDGEYPESLSLLFNTYFCTEDQQTLAQVLSGIAGLVEENTRAIGQLTQVQMEYAKSVHQLAKVCASLVSKS